MPAVQCPAGMPHAATAVHGAFAVHAPQGDAPRGFHASTNDEVGVKEMYDWWRVMINVC